MKPREIAAVLLALATLLGAIGDLYKAVREDRKDQAFAWDAYGDQVAEVERLKERLVALECLTDGAARVEGACRVEVKP